MIRPRSSAEQSAVLASGLALLRSAGCAAQLDPSYGRSRGQSINGTGVVADLFRESGHDGPDGPPPDRRAGRVGRRDRPVRAAPGPPERDEARWYDEWLSHEPGRRADLRPPRLRRAGRLLVRRARRDSPRTLPPPSGPAPRSSATRPASWPADLPPGREGGRRSRGLVRRRGPKPTPPEVCETLGGPWGRGDRRRRAALPRHATLKVESETDAPDGRRPAAGDRVDPHQREPGAGRGQRCLPAQRHAGQRRPAAPGAAGGRLGRASRPRNVAFVEGADVLGDRAGRAVDLRAAPRPAVRLGGRADVRARPGGVPGACPRLGRARPDPPSDADRPPPIPRPSAPCSPAPARPSAGPRRSLDAYPRSWRKKSDRSQPWRGAIEPMSGRSRTAPVTA